MSYYVPHTEQDRAEMLEVIGVKSGKVEELFGVIPQGLRIDSLDLPPGKSEFEVMKELQELARK
ncbi:glycine dehydrogenase, partial [bacterium]|nr:glycine dehydrogenase [bacterium]